MLYYKKIMGVVVVLSLLFSSSVQAEKKKKEEKTAKKGPQVEEKYENLGLFQKVLFFIEQNYVDDVKNKELIYGAIKGMLETLDPHSSFLPPEIFKEMKVDTSGKFGGIGIEIGVKNSILTVITPIEDTPAYHADIRPGDKVLKINGTSTKGMSMVEAISKMRGKKGAPVSITIWRDGFKRPKDIKLVRAEIKIQAAKSDVLEPGYLYLRLTTFNETSSDDLKKAIEVFEKKNGKLKGLVLDLRNNPGGLLDEAVDIASLFLQDGIVVSTMGRDPSKKEIRYVKKGTGRTDFSVAVLVNGASASASEIVAGALQDHKRALIMGQPTFGKGSVQTVVELLPEVGLKLTIAKYYTPKGRSIQLKGIEPDILLEDYDPKLLTKAVRNSSTYIREKDLRNHMANEQKPDDKNEQANSNEDFAPEEYVSTENLKSSPKDSSKTEDALEDVKNTPFVAKDDYQVREALNYIKSFEYLERQHLEAKSDAVSGKN